jgi:hypothetical protein
MNISQSLIKRIWNYIDGNECGLAIKEVDILKNYQSKPTEPMKLGQYFEYICTGAVLRDGSIPEAPVTKKGDLTADGKRAHEQANNFNEILSYHGIEILSVGDTITHKIDDKYDLKIVTDSFIKTPQEEKAILDIKFTGLLGDKWLDVGWDLDKFKYRKKLNIQPLFYKYVMEKATGIKDIPFYYAIHSSKNEDFELWCVNIPNYQSVMDQVAYEVDRIIEIIEKDSFPPIPEVKRCRMCPLYNDCLFKEEYPSIKTATVYSLNDEIRKVQQNN